MFNGNIAGVRIYNRALTSNEISHMYLAERLNYLNWWQRVAYWVKMTWLTLVGKI